MTLLSKHDEDMQPYHEKNNTVFYWEENLKHLKQEAWDELLFKNTEPHIFLKKTNSSFPSLYDQRTLFLEHASISLKSFSIEQQKIFWKIPEGSITTVFDLYKNMWANPSTSIALENLFSIKKFHPKKSFLKSQSHKDTTVFVMHIDQALRKNKYFHGQLVAELKKGDTKEIKWFIAKISQYHKSVHLSNFGNELRNILDIKAELKSIKPVKIQSIPQKIKIF